MANALKTDFDYAIKNMGSGTETALIHARAVGRRPIPVGHKRTLGRVIDYLEKAEAGLLVLATEAWPEERPLGFFVPAPSKQLKMPGMI